MKRSLAFPNPRFWNHLCIFMVSALYTICWDKKNGWLMALVAWDQKNYFWLFLVLTSFEMQTMSGKFLKLDL